MNDFYNDCIDNETARILQYIKKNPKATRTELREKYDNADDSIMLYLCAKDYLVCIHPNGTVSTFAVGEPRIYYPNDTFWLTPKGKAFIEMNNSRKWQWLIPTLISITALIISVLSAIFPGVVKVMLI